MNSTVKAGLSGRAENSLIGFLMSDSLKKMSDSLIRSFLVSALSDSLTLLIKKGGMSELLVKKRTKNIPKNTILQF